MMIDVNVLAMYFGWFALAFVPTVYLLQFFRQRKSEFLARISRFFLS